LTYKGIARLKQVFRLVHRRNQLILGSILLGIAKFSCFILKPKIVLTYANSPKPDGVGAQLQRIFAIRSLADTLRLGYKHTPISSVAVHPLDPYQTVEEMKIFVSRLNQEFLIKDSKFDDTVDLVEYEVRELTFSRLFLCILKCSIRKKQTLIKCVEAYSIVERDPKIYSKLIQFLPNYIPLHSAAKTLAIHYRRGVGGLSVQHGEKISREITSSYFVSISKKIMHQSMDKSLKLVIYTDSPPADLIFSPPPNQLNLWENSLRFNGREMQIIGLDLEKIFEDISSSVEVVYGGDPLDVIKALASADHLVLSRSSFGYVAGLLNNHGEIYFPSEFWHIPKQGWKVITEVDYE
jgi:hypothetical protein